MLPILKFRVKENASTNLEPQDRILQKAQELFLRYGIRSVSMDEIASQLGMSKKTIYQFYTDKDALVQGVIDTEINCSKSECLSHKDRCENPVHEIYLAVEMVQDMLRVMNPSIIYDMQKYHPRAFKKLRDHQEQFLYGIIKENLDEGITLGLYRADIDTHILAKFRLASVFLLFDQHLFPADKFNIADVLTEMTMNFLHGLITPKGQKLIEKYSKQTKTKQIHETN